MSESIEIARYPNRRLYDRSQKKYVTLGDIEEMVLAGKDVRVRDSKSGDDLTGMILTQIILERHPERMKMFSVPFLHALLRADQMALDWLTVYFGQAMNVMKGTSAIPLPGFPGFDIWKGVMPDATTGNESQSTGPGSSDVPSKPESPISNEERGLEERLAKLERRLRELEGRDEQSVDTQSKK